MIQTRLAVNTPGVSVESQSSIRPGDDSDAPIPGTNDYRVMSQSSIRPGDDSDKESFSVFGAEEEIQSQSSIRPGDDSDPSSAQYKFGTPSSQSSIRPGDDSDHSHQQRRSR